MASEETIPLDRWLRHLKRYLKVARSGIDPEGVHQVRVATRRLDAWLILGGWRVYRDDLRWLRARASAVRDIDVLLSHKGLPRVLKSLLIARKKEANTEFIMACDDPRLSALIAGLGAMHPISEGDARKRLVRLGTDVMRCGARVERNEDGIESLHRLRRAIRRLRYGVEFVGESATPLKKLQELLGGINDLAVGMRRLDSLPADKAPARFRETLNDELAVLLPKAHALWIAEREAIKKLGT